MIIGYGKQEHIKENKIYEKDNNGISTAHRSRNIQLLQWFP